MSNYLTRVKLLVTMLMDLNTDVEQVKRQPRKANEAINNMELLLSELTELSAGEEIDKHEVERFCINGVIRVSKYHKHASESDAETKRVIENIHSYLDDYGYGEMWMNHVNQTKVPALGEL